MNCHIGPAVVAIGCRPDAQPPCRSAAGVCVNAAHGRLRCGP
jgi:hypothetical protein